MDADRNRPADHAHVDLADAPPPPRVREAHDATDEKALARNPSHEQAKLEVGLDESFPSSDPPAVAQPGHGEPAPSSGYDQKAERQRERDRR
ncbi:MAG TPA: hypothetical protein VKQ09_11460 [Sphingomonas sp.]|nr:hypothetical protein [Sphingomonas sp.]